MLLDESTMILLPFLLLSVLNSIPLTYSLKNKDLPCNQFDTCKCLFPTGRGINLYSINSDLSVEVKTNTTILLHLCENISFGPNISTNQCFHNASVCYVDSSKNLSLSLGKTENMKFISKSQFQPFSIRFENQQNTTNINLKCNKESDDNVLTLKSVEGSVYNLELESKHACVHLFTSAEGPSGGLSTGSVLVIILLVFTLVYFGGGMLSLRLLRGAEGREMIPNIEFWMDLPYLVRDGVIFAMNGFRPATTYDRI